MTSVPRPPDPHHAAAFYDSDEDLRRRELADVVNVEIRSGATIVELQFPLS
jgi:hypothetical protein